MKNMALIEALNQMLAQDEASTRQNAASGAAACGPGVEAVVARLQDICPDEFVHVGRLRQRILALGGIPMNVHEELAAIDKGTRFLETVSPDKREPLGN